MFCTICGLPLGTRKSCARGGVYDRVCAVASKTVRLETVRVKIWTEISGERLAGNFAAVEAVLAGSTGGDGLAAPALLAVVKANAYGHGIAACAPVLAGAGAEWLGATDASEGAAVRAALDEAGVPVAEQPAILVMSAIAGLPGEADAIVRYRLTPVVSSLHQIQCLSEAAKGLGEALPIHLEIDTGMSRQGVASNMSAIYAAIAGSPQLRLSGLMTHFASTEVAHSSQTAGQRDVFERVVAAFADRGVRLDWVHVGNSSYIDNDDKEGWLPWLSAVARRAGARSMVRSGLALYGYLLPIEGMSRAAIHDAVRPVLTWKTRVLAVTEVAPGALVGYNGTFRAPQAMRLALLPAGYADGLRRELSSTDESAGGWVMIHGQRAPIVGRVSMNLTSVDVSGIADLAEGDEAVLLGEGITAEDHARIAKTISYEILCGIRASAYLT